MVFRIPLIRINDYPHIVKIAFFSHNCTLILIRSAYFHFAPREELKLLVTRSFQTSRKFNHNKRIPDRPVLPGITAFYSNQFWISIRICSVIIKFPILFKKDPALYRFLRGLVILSKYNKKHLCSWDWKSGQGKCWFCCRELYLKSKNFVSELNESWIILF